jgi:hypothetical protein
VSFDALTNDVFFLRTSAKALRLLASLRSVSATVFALSSVSAAPRERTENDENRLLPAFLLGRTAANRHGTQYECTKAREKKMKCGKRE